METPPPKPLSALTSLQLQDMFVAAGLRQGELALLLPELRHIKLTQLEGTTAAHVAQALHSHAQLQDMYIIEDGSKQQAPGGLLACCAAYHSWSMCMWRQQVQALRWVWSWMRRGAASWPACTWQATAAAGAGAVHEQGQQPGHQGAAQHRRGAAGEAEGQRSPLPCLWWLQHVQSDTCLHTHESAPLP